MAKGKKIAHKNLILLIVAVAQFMVILDVAIVNVALPSIFRELKFSNTDSLQWVVTAYTLAFGGFLLLGGRAADLFGRKRVFTAGLAMFSLVSLICGLSQSDTMLTVARGFQGLAAAFMSPAALSIVLTTFSEGKERHRALGVWAAVSAGGAAVGVLLGGILTQYLNWRWNFFVNVPVGIVLVFTTIKLLPESKADLGHRQLDLPGAVLATVGLMSLVYGLSKAPSAGWTSMTTIGFVGAAIVLLLAFLYNEKRSKHPLMPLSIFKIRNVLGANLTQLPITASMFSIFFFLTLYIQTVLGFSPVKTGFSFLPITFIIAIVSTVVSRLLIKVGYKPFLLIAPVFLTGSFLWFGKIEVGGSYWVDVFPGLVMMALGMGMMFLPITVAATNGVPAHESGLASGLLNTAQQIGGAVGLAVLSGVAASQTTEMLKTVPHNAAGIAEARVAGFQEAFHIAVVFAVLAFFLALFLIHQKKGEKIDPEAAMGG